VAQCVCAFSATLIISMLCGSYGVHGQRELWNHRSECYELESLLSTADQHYALSYVTPLFDMQAVQLSARAQLHNITHRTTTTSAHRPPTLTVNDKQHKHFCFQVTYEDMRSSLKWHMDAETCRSLRIKQKSDITQCTVLVSCTQSNKAQYEH
jgi:hypothetical protein